MANILLMVLIVSSEPLGWNKAGDTRDEKTCTPNSRDEGTQTATHGSRRRRIPLIPRYRSVQFRLGTVKVKLAVADHAVGDMFAADRLLVAILRAGPGIDGTGGRGV